MKHLRTHSAPTRLQNESVHDSASQPLRRFDNLNGKDDGFIEDVFLPQGQLASLPRPIAKRAMPQCDSLHSIAVSDSPAIGQFGLFKRPEVAVSNSAPEGFGVGASPFGQRLKKRSKQIEEINELPEVPPQTEVPSLAELRPKPKSTFKAFVDGISQLCNSMSGFVR